MQPHQQRIVEEKKALDEKWEKMEAFMDGDVYAKLTTREQELLVSQFRIMMSYYDILKARIELFKENV